MENNNNFEEQTEKSLHQSEIDFLNSKYQYELKQAEINYNVKLEYMLLQEKERLEKEYSDKLEGQKAFYENELKNQKDWYEKEILRRQEETANWHRENTQKLLDEQKRELEEKFVHKPVSILKEEEENPVKVSVILPIYNVGKYLEQCLNSLISQTLYDIEIICVNDGSTDNCYNILEEYKQKDGRIKVIHKENEGTGIARNTGLKVATGECVAFVDPDDWIQCVCLTGLMKKSR